jgi:putative spermidine/putrescine transport system permease protein
MMLLPGQASTSRRSAATGLFLLPSLIVIAVLLVGPLIVLFLTSLTPELAGEVQYRPSTAEHYERFIFDSYFLAMLWKTVWVAGLGTLLAALIAYPLAIGIMYTRSGWLRTLYLFAGLSPLLVSVVIRTFGWQILLGSASPLGSLFAGIAGSSILHSTPAIVIGLTHLGIPFVLLALLPSMNQVDINVLKAATNLGARPITITRRILTPLVLPGLTAGCIIAFSINATVIVTPRLLGGRESVVFQGVIYDQMLWFFNWSFASALSVVLLAVVLVVTGAFSFWMRRIYLRPERQEAKAASRSGQEPRGLATEQDDVEVRS